MTSETPSMLGVRRLLEWLRVCEELGWPKSSMGALTDIFWKYKDRDGNLKGENQQTGKETPVAPANTNTGHGHVRPRPDGVRARCGGPGICNECSREAALNTGASRES